MQAEIQTTRSSIRILLFAVLILSLAAGLGGCTRMIIYPSEETATAMASMLTSTPQDTPETQTLVEEQHSLLPEEETTPTPFFTPTATPTMVATRFEPTRTPSPTEKPPILYYTLSGDIIESIAVRFGVEAEEIIATDGKDIPRNALLEPDRLFLIPDRLEDTTPNDKIMPDSEIAYSPSTVNFDINGFVDQAGGYLTEYREWRTDGWYVAGGIISRVASENSVNPRLLLAVLEYQSGWVYGQPDNLAELDYPMGWKNFEDKELYKQLTWSVQQLFIGYYGWRAGTLTDLTFPDGSTVRIASDLNAGTVAVQYLFSKLYDKQDWSAVLYASDGFPALYEEMFGNAWLRAQAVEPLYPPNLEQPFFELPFEPGKTWNLTGGPHAVWGKDGVMAALDFAPPLSEHGCVLSPEWVTAVAPGLVIRSHNGYVMVDLDGDGYEQTGWAILYMHIYHDDRIAVGEWVNTGDPIGHPSCEGGVATGTHLHIARKYNGEWIPADGPLPFNLDGWIAHNGVAPYEGTLTRGDQVVTAHVYGSYDTAITRDLEPTETANESSEVNGSN